MNIVIKFERSVSDGILPSPLPNFSLFAQFLRRFCRFLIWVIPAINFSIRSNHLLPPLFRWSNSHSENFWAHSNCGGDSSSVDLRSNSSSWIFAESLYHTVEGGFGWRENHCLSLDSDSGTAFWAFDSHLLDALSPLPLLLAYYHLFSSKVLSFDTLWTANCICGLILWVFTHIFSLLEAFNIRFRLIESVPVLSFSSISPLLL